MGSGIGNSIPVPGDYDDSGKTELAVYLTASGSFAYRPADGGKDQIIQFGIPGIGNSIPVPGDYDGSGKTELAVYLPSSGDYAYRPADGGSDQTIQFGTPASAPSIPISGLAPIASTLTAIPNDSAAPVMSAASSKVSIESLRYQEAEAPKALKQGSPTSSVSQRPKPLVVVPQKGMATSHDNINY